MFWRRFTRLRLIFLYKVSNKKESLEDFKTAISSTARSLSNSQKIEVVFGNQSTKSNENSIKLPDFNGVTISLIMRKLEL